MNPSLILRAGQIIFKFRRLLALAVLVEFAARRAMNQSSKKSKKSKSSDLDLQAFANDALSQVQGVIQDLKKRTR